MTISTELIPWVFGAFLLAGGGYLLISILLGGDIGDLDIEGDTTGLLDAGGELLAGADTVEAEARGIGCSTIAAFLAGFGAMGLFASLAGWHPLVSVLVALLFGVLLGRVVIAALRWISRQQGGTLLRKTDLIGSVVRVTVPTPAGKYGEGMIEDGERIKYAIKNLADGDLAKGDFVEVMDVVEGRLLVKKKRYTHSE